MVNEQNKRALPNRLAGDAGYKNKTLLITGALGYMGKVLVEKMLRTCPLVKKIYVIVRIKKGKNPQDRLKELFKSPLFDLLKETQGEKILEKVIAIEGDIAALNLGLSPENYKLLTKEVEIIFHLAATVRFDEPLKSAILLNARGTKLLLNLAKDCKKLLAFAHVSTAYSHPEERVLYEKTYPPPGNPHDIIKIMELLDEDISNSLASKITRKSPNTYTYTKALAEGLVNDEMENLPVIILRPSVVVPILKDPIPGWCDNFGGPVALMIATASGVVRSIYCNPTSYADFVPVDVAINTMMLNTYDYMTYKKRRVYNLTTSESVKITWSELCELGIRNCEKMPFNKILWYPTNPLQSSKWRHNLYILLFQYIPAILVDCLITLSGNKPFLWKLQEKIRYGSNLLEYYTNNQWDFQIDGSLEARKLLNEHENEIYKYDAEGIDLEKYMYSCCRAARLYLLKESEDTIPSAKRHMKIMWVLDRVCKILMLIGFGYILLKYIIFPVIGLKF